MLITFNLRKKITEDCSRNLPWPLPLASPEFFIQNRVRRTWTRVRSHYISSTQIIWRFVWTSYWGYHLNSGIFKTICLWERFFSKLPKSYRKNAFESFNVLYVWFRRLNRSKLFYIQDFGKWMTRNCFKRMISKFLREIWWLVIRKISHKPNVLFHGHSNLQKIFGIAFLFKNSIKARFCPSISLIRKFSCKKISLKGKMFY